MTKNYLNSINQSFQYYKLLGDQTFAQLSDEDFFYVPDANENSVAIIVKHLWGNLLSRWTNFLNEDGEKDWRKRDEEFVADIKDKTELLEKWNEGWTCLFEALSTINEDNFDNLVYIRNQGHTIVEACNRQLAHYAYHIGQIVFLGKMIKGNHWKSLSIPKGDSEKFNAEKFEKQKHQVNFVEEYLNPENNQDTKKGDLPEA
ncbi:MAG: hypothetical protein ACI8XB_001568 [Patiriisocius sp.]|jgi:hypothetical protein